MMAFVWLYFIELHNSRSYNASGVNPISYADILAYFTLLGIEPQEWEIQVIKRLDFIALKMQSDEIEKQKNQAASKRKSK